MNIDPPLLGYLCDLVYRRSAIVLTPDKEYLVESRLGPVARTHGYESINALITALRGQPPGALVTTVVEAMTTNETTFFRDHHPFEALRKEILPALRKARAATRSIVILCAACSTGQEPYSIAMMLKEQEAELAGWNIRIVGVDLAQSILERAREGRYHQSEVNRGLPAPLLIKYFDRIGVDWQLKKSIRDMVELRQMNLIEPWPSLPPVDLLFIRNVLIYFDLPTKRAILARARKAMARDAYLMLGGAETTINVDDNFERVALGPTTVYRMVSTR